MPPHLLRPLIFIWLLSVALIGTAVGVGYLLPDGNQILYTETFDSSSNSPHTVNIFLRDMERSIDQRLSEGYGISVGAKWSPNGKQIAYLSLNDSVFDVYLIDATGRNKRRLGFEFTTLDSGYIWSPDSQRLLFSVTVGGNAQSVLLNATTGQVDILPQAVYSGMWSPDSQTVVYQAASESGRQHLYGMNINCLVQGQPCEFKELTFLQNQDFYDNLVWSPDGYSLAFISNSGDQSNVVVASLRCADLVEVCVEKYTVVGYKVYNWEPIWSADSKRLAYVKSSTEIDVNQIETGVSETYNVANGLVFFQSWSADGQFITYISNPMALLGNNIYYVLDVQTGESRKLFENPYTVESLEWRPNPH